MSDQPENLGMRHHIVAFVDLLGQKKVLAGIPLFPKLDDPEEMTHVNAALKKSIGAVARLHRDFNDFFRAYSTKEPPAFLSDEQKQLYAKMTFSNLKMQRFSDGLVFFKAIDIPPTMHDVFGLLAACGSTVFAQLIRGEPVRIGIDLHQAVELYENEIYGPALACAAHLESKVAQYPRAVLGKAVIQYLNAVETTKDADVLADYNRTIAKLCRELLLEDIDGHIIIDYLGASFRDHVGKFEGEHVMKAYDFIKSQGDEWRRTNDTTLALRYVALAEYFEEHMADWGFEEGKDRSQP
jgi:hypothetical protein